MTIQFDNFGSKIRIYSDIQRGKLFFSSFIYRDIRHTVCKEVVTNDSERKHKRRQRTMSAVVDQIERVH